jgi:hypothetical protein
MDKVRKPSNSVCYTPSSEPYKSYYCCEIRKSENRIKSVRIFDRSLWLKKWRFANDDDDYNMKKCSFYLKRSKRLMLFREIIAIYSDVVPNT